MLDCLNKSLSQDPELQDGAAAAVLRGGPVHGQQQQGQQGREGEDRLRTVHDQECRGRPGPHEQVGRSIAFKTAEILLEFFGLYC